MSRQPLLIIGASGRAATASALRAGFDPFVLDLFADADTERLCPVRKLPMADYPHGFVELAKAVPPMPWMYTGGLENHPDVVAAISATRELWGNGPDVLAKVRDPLAVAAWLAEFKRDHPATVLPGGELPAEQRWLRKPLRGSAGHGVRFARPEDWAAATDHYLQEFLDGPAMSAVFAHGRRGWPTFVGMTRQLIGTPWLHAKPFAYAGNILADYRHGPDPRPTAGWLTFEFPLTGVWGFDFIRHNGRTAVVEVNPRYTASVEVIEYAARTAALPAGGRLGSLPPYGGGLERGVAASEGERLSPVQARLPLTPGCAGPSPQRGEGVARGDGASGPSPSGGEFEARPLPAGERVAEGRVRGERGCQGERHSPSDSPTPLPSPPPQGGREQEVVGKAIYYAPHALTFPASGPWDDSLAHCTDVWRRPDFADIPHAGDAIEAGQPVCTILAGADTEAACEAKLQERAAELDRLFGWASPKLHQMDD